MKRVYYILLALLVLELVLMFSSVLVFMKAYNYLHDGEGSPLTLHQTSSGTVDFVIGSAQPAPDPTPTPSPGSGGGGSSSSGGSISKKHKLQIIPQEINFVLDSGESGQKSLSVKNTGDEIVVIDIEIIGLNDFSGLSTYQLVLKPTQSEEIIFSAVAPDVADVYSGKIIFSTPKVSKEVLVLINVNDPLTLFDVSTFISEDSKIILHGRDGKVVLLLSILGFIKEEIVTIEFTIKDFDGNLHYTETFEERITSKETTIVKDIIAHNLVPGNYFVEFKLLHISGRATASETFVVKPPIVFIEKPKKFLIVLLLLIVVMMLAIFWAYYKYKKSNYYYKLKKKQKKRFKKR